jgi:hypothetical protein
MVASMNWLSFLAVPFAACGLLLGQNSHDLKVADYQKQKERASFEAGQRHLEIGSWARKAKLVPQATTQFLRAVAVSDGKNQGATTVLGIMRAYGDAFWRGERKKPEASVLALYERQALDADRRDRKEQMELARKAADCELLDAAKEHCTAALRFGGRLAIDDKGHAKVDGENVPAVLSEWIAQQTIKVNDGERTFDAASGAAASLANLREQRSDRLVVRTDLPGETLKELHALATALLPHLQARLDGAPTRPLGLFVFARQADYAAYLQARGLGDCVSVAGLADYGSFQTLICAEGKGDEELRALMLHELSHLFFFGVAPAAMPDWYAEGFAESFGGQGTFTWDGKTLKVGGKMRADRIADLKTAPLPLRELLAGDALKLMVGEREKGLRFYVQSWALQRFLLEKDNPWQDRFQTWEANCRGAVLGAAEGRRFGDVQPARAVFDRMFKDDLDKMDTAFRAWLDKL